MILSILAPAMLEGGSWAVCYSERPTLDELAPYGLLVLDDRHHPPLEPLRASGKTVLGYLSIGEVEQTRSYFAAVKREGVLLEENPDWKGSYRIDMRSRLWRWRVVNQIMPALLRMGFDGVFLDTVDVAGYLEDRDPGRFAGMKLAAVELVREIRARYPKAKIMMNRGFDLLPDVAGELDAVLAESTRARYNFANKTYQLVPEQEYQAAVETLRAAARLAPSLSIYTLDYWNSDDPRGIEAIYREQRANGFAPYVSTILLDRIIPEPGNDSALLEGLP